MKDKKLVTVLFILVIILLVSGAYLLGKSNSKNLNLSNYKYINSTNGVLENNKNQNKIISQSEAENLVKKTWGDCTGEGCSSFSVTSDQNNLVTAIYPQLDDSVSAVKKEAAAIYNNGTWTLGIPTITQMCHKNRGHQDFSNAPCI